MLRKLTVLLIATLFSVSVAGLSYAQTKPGDKPADKPAAKPGDKPAATPAAKPGDKPAANPCAAGETTKKKAKDEKATTMAPEKPKPAEPAKPAAPAEKK